MEKLDILAKGALLHDIGKVCIRSTNTKRETHSQAGAKFVQRFLSAGTENEQILNCVKFHHSGELRNASLAKNDLAYIVYEADNIAAASDRREIEDGKNSFDTHKCLDSVFNIFAGLNTAKAGQYSLSGLNSAASFNYPTQESIVASKDKYESLVDYFVSNFQRGDLAKMSNNELLRILEDLTSFVPSSTNVTEACDISLYNHSKITAAIACCMYQYFVDNNITDYKAACMDNAKEKRQEEAFLLVSGDISGIQNFIYTIPSNGALKSLRGHSFYLELFMENYIDEMLEALNLSRANLLYTGGGHFYLLAANTSATQETICKVQHECNKWLCEHFGSALYMATAFTTCSANDLKCSEQQRSIFAAVSAALNQDKLSRYDGELLTQLFTQQEISEEGRECSVCHRTSMKLTASPIGDGLICPTCLGLYKLGQQMLEGETNFIISSKPVENSMEIFSLEGTVYLGTASKDALDKEKNIKRIYGKNSALTGKLMGTRLWVADYISRDITNKTLEFSALAEASCSEEQGIKRLGVLRADVDNLGAAFIGGFVDYKNEIADVKYATLSRYADLSRNLGLFFKLAVTKLCAGEMPQINGKTMKPFNIYGTKKNKMRKVHVVYSGGDDMFLVGAWDDLLELAVDIRNAFKLYTGGKLTFSAGLGMYKPAYPISQMAELTGKLENEAKNVPGKNSIALFGFETAQKDAEYELVCQNIYNWDEFENKVCREKLDFLLQHLALTDKDKNKLPAGKSMLYRLMQLLDVDEDKMNIARFVYTLARMQPPNKNLENIFNEFQAQLFQWIKQPEDCRQLRTALYLIIYYLREEGEE